VRAVNHGGRGDWPRLVGGLWITTVAVHEREWAPVDSLVYFRQPHHGQELVCIEIRGAGPTRGARSRGTSWQTSAGTIDVATIIYGIYI